jgi:hypothetical protein
MPRWASGEQIPHKPDIRPRCLAQLLMLLGAYLARALLGVLPVQCLKAGECGPHVVREMADRYSNAAISLAIGAPEQT